MTSTLLQPTDESDHPPNRRLGLALGIGLVWVAVLVGAWAIQPLSDSQMVGFVELDDGGFEAVTVDVDCNTLFSSDARDTSVALPDLGDDLAFPRTPCDKPHSDARIIFVMNAVVVALLAAGWTTWFRQRRT